jgi:hypothetical protein
VTDHLLKFVRDIQDGLFVEFLMALSGHPARFRKYPLDHLLHLLLLNGYLFTHFVSVDYLFDEFAASLQLARLDLSNLIAAG